MFGVSCSTAVTSNPSRLENLCSNIIDQCISNGAICAKNGLKMTADDIKELKDIFTKSMKSDLKDLENIEQARNMMVKACDHLIASNKHSINAEKLKQEAKQHRINSEQHRSNSEQHRIKSEQHLNNAAKLKAEAEKEYQKGLIKQFLSIFNEKNQLSAEESDVVFQTYLVDRSLTVEKSLDGDVFGRINSMNSVIKYLKAHPLTKMCDFRTFKAEVNDVETFADFLKTPEAYAVKALAFKSTISDIAKEKLAEAVSARASTRSTLKVQYFA